MKNIELELQSINNRYKKEFITECETSEAIKNLLDERRLLTKYKTNLEKELDNTILNYSIDKNERYGFEVIKRAGIIDLENIFKIP